MKQGDKVRWHLLSMGNEKDLHTPHWHGKTVDYQKRHVDVIELLPGSMATADMIADNPGTWLFHCHVSDHMENGMMATYTIYSPPRSCPVAIVPEDWAHVAASSSIRIRNIGGKPIRQVSLLSGYLVNTLQSGPGLLSEPHRLSRWNRVEASRSRRLLPCLLERSRPSQSACAAASATQA